MKSIVSYFFILFACSTPVIAFNKSQVNGSGPDRVWVNKRFKTQDEALEFMIEHSIPIINLETAASIERFKKLLKYWNPQIKDWREIDAWENIYVYRESPLYDISLGYHYYKNKESLADSGDVLSENQGLTLDLRLSFVHTLKWHSYLNYKFLKKNKFQLGSSSQIYSFPLNHSVEYGGVYRPSFSNWSYAVAAGWEQFSFISFNNNRYKILKIIEDNLQVSMSEVFWIVPSIHYRFSILNHGSYLSLGAGYSPIGKKSLDDSSQEEDIISTKWNIRFKQYLEGNLWMEIYYQSSEMKGDSSTNQIQYGAFLGLSI